MKLSVKAWIVTGIALATLLLDYLTKTATRSFLVPGKTLPLIEGVIHLTHHQNRGAAFGILQDQNLFLIILTLMVLVGIAFFYDDLPKKKTVWVFLGLITGGAIGNLFDRVILGYVTDFIDLQIWPIFNVADTALTVGVVGIAGYMIWDDMSRKNKGKSKVGKK